jgi:hypothetical protein
MNIYKKQTLVNKGCQQKGFFAAIAFTNQAKPQAAKYCPITVALVQYYGKYCYALPTHKARIVLADFARSCSADRENFKFIGSINEPKREKALG